jgi:hypothetical protein
VTAGPQRVGGVILTAAEDDVNALAPLLAASPEVVFIPNEPW